MQIAGALRLMIDEMKDLDAALDFICLGDVLNIPEQLKQVNPKP